MERAFKFREGDVVRTKEGNELVATVGIFDKEYRKHLTVVYHYWDGRNCCYVLNTGDDYVCVICDEADLELEERAPMPAEEVHPECDKGSYFLGHVYCINDRIVAAEGIEQAIRLFHNHPISRHALIEKIILQDQSLALIQNGKEE